MFADWTAPVILTKVRIHYRYVAANRDVSASGFRLSSE